MSNNTPTIYQLRKSGAKVRVIHSISMEGQRITKIELTTQEGSNSCGMARCHLGDNYNRKIGNAIALGRAIKASSKGLDGVFKKLNVYFS